MKLFGERWSGPVLDRSWWSMSFLERLYHKTASTFSKIFPIYHLLIFYFGHPGNNKYFNVYWRNIVQNKKRGKEDIFIFYFDALVYARWLSFLHCLLRQYYTCCLPAPHHRCFYVSACNLQSYGFKKCLAKINASRDREVWLTKQKASLAWAETKTWKPALRAFIESHTAGDHADRKTWAQNLKHRFILWTCTVCTLWRLH